MSRKKALGKPFPSAWAPKVGDEVYIAAKGIGKLVDRATVLAIGAGCVLVRAFYGRLAMRGYFTVEELRPIPANQQRRPDADVTGVRKF